MNLELINYLWIPNIFIYNLKTFQTIEVLSKLAGLWIDANKRIYYSQATHITFICPMVFDSFPLDTQKCKFQVFWLERNESLINRETFRLEVIRTIWAEWSLMCLHLATSSSPSPSLWTTRSPLTISVSRTNSLTAELSATSLSPASNWQVLTWGEQFVIVLVSETWETFYVLHHNLLSPIRPVRGGVLDILPNPPRYSPR